MDLTKLLAQELGKTNPLVNLSLYDVEKLKEQFSCCAEDELAYEKTQKSCEIEQHTLPDGQVCDLSNDTARFCSYKINLVFLISYSTYYGSNS